MRSNSAAPEAPAHHRLGRSGTAEAAAGGSVLLLCVIARVPHHLLEALGVRGWVLGLALVVIAVNGARLAVRAPFHLAASVVAAGSRRAGVRAWLRAELRTLAVTVIVGTLLTIPLYALLRTVPAWWLPAWLLFAAVTVIGAGALPFTLRFVVGPVAPAPADVAARVHAVAARAGADVGAVLVADRPDRRGCNAYVVGMGPSRRLMLDKDVASWPGPELDQVVAHEIGHWQLGHTARRLPITLAVQLATLAFAAWLLASPAVLDWAGVEHVGDPRSYALLLLLTPLLVLPAQAVLAWRDRTQERQADRFALRLLEEPDEFASMLERARTAAGLPDQLPWWRRLTSSHPSIAERAAACRRSPLTA